MEVGVIGTGYVGLVTGACLAFLGHNVNCIDIDQSKVDNLKKGQCPIFEPGLDEILEKTLSNNRLHFSTDYKNLPEIIFLAVGTPSLEDGGADLKYLFAALDSLINLDKKGILVLKSTVPLGTHKLVRDYVNNRLEVVSNPEFLKEGHAVKDFLHPERIVLGGEKDSVETLKELYQPLLNAGAKLICTDNASAELIKYASNCFLATKISFMNELARVCESAQANINDVKKGMGTDSRIGSAFLNPGPGYGGSCFPKDVLALLSKAREWDHPLEVISAAHSANERQGDWLLAKISSQLGPLQGKKISFWGTAFKAHTDDVRESPALKLGQKLVNLGCSLHVYDPCALENFCAELPQAKGKKDAYAVLEDSDALVIMTEWPEFSQIDWEKLKKSLKGRNIFDARNMVDFDLAKQHGFFITGVGR